MEDKFTLQKCREYVENTINKVTISSMYDNQGTNEEELKKRINRMNKLEEALKICTYGDKKSKMLVKNYIEEILEQYGVNEKTIDKVKDNTNSVSMSIIDKFNILLHKYNKEYNVYGFQELIKKYNLDRLRNINGRVCYAIIKEDIEEIYEKENIKLKYRDKLELITQEIYSRYKGLGVIDELRDMYLDGISGGVSGIPKDFEGMRNISNLPKAYESVWCMFDGKNIRLEPLSFGSYEELERVTSLIYKFNNPGDLTTEKGGIVNTMADSSRVVSLRPPFCEEWIFFARKFDVSDISLEALITCNNREVVIALIVFMMKGCQNVIITGEQGTGKSTILVSMLEYIYDILPLRFVELAFELHSRRRYPFKNIVSLQETQKLSSQDALNILKKTDGSVTIVGEVADDKTCTNMIETAQVASKFTLCTHHAKKFRDLVMALRNSLLKSGLFKNEIYAEEQVVNVLDFNIHLEKNMNGKRYIERITECVLTSDEERYKIGKLYEENDIMIYDEVTNTFVIKNCINKDRIKRMAKEMSEEDGKEFYKLIEKLNVQAAANKK